MPGEQSADLGVWDDVFRGKQQVGVSKLSETDLPSMLVVLVQTAGENRCRRETSLFSRKEVLFLCYLGH